MTRKLLVDENHKLLNEEGLFFKEFASDPEQIRFYTILVIKNAGDKIKENNLLEQQLSEIIKNAIIHGNGSDKSKKVKVWFDIGNDHAKFIVQDEGPGFQEIEKWNDFLDKRQKAFESGDFEAMMKYVAFKTEKSRPEDGGNSLFAAVEYWNGGIVYNNARNKVGVMRVLDY